MATVLITGGTGLIGTALTRELVKRQHHVIILTRDAKQKPAPSIQYAHWDVEKGEIDKSAIAQADYIVHLAGENVAGKRWTEKRKQQIVNSRVDSGTLLVKSLAETDNKVRAVISASGIGWYGPDPVIPNPHPFKETQPPAADFLGITCEKWENAIAPVTAMDKRLVILRTGIVLSKEGGAYPEFKKTLSFGVASVLGDGKQIISWIHIDDLVNIYLEAINNTALSGVYNAVAPAPVSNAHLIRAIAKHAGKPHITLPVPTFALKLLLGEMSVEVLKSTTVSAEKIAAAGYVFRQPTIAQALRHL